MGLGGSWAELVESQGRCAAGEQTILKQLPAPEALGSQVLEVLPQELDGIVVLSETFVAVPLAPQPGSHARGVNALLHPELAALAALCHSSPPRWMSARVRVERQWDVNRLNNSCSNYVTYCRGFDVNHCGSPDVNLIEGGNGSRLTHKSE